MRGLGTMQIETERERMKNYWSVTEQLGGNRRGKLEATYLPPHQNVSFDSQREFFFVVPIQLLFTVVKYGVGWKEIVSGIFGI
jgi:hypothetical protein